MVGVHSWQAMGVGGLVAAIGVVALGVGWSLIEAAVPWAQPPAGAVVRHAAAPTWRRRLVGGFAGLVALTVAVPVTMLGVLLVVWGLTAPWS